MKKITSNATDNIYGYINNGDKFIGRKAGDKLIKILTFIEVMDEKGIVYEESEIVGSIPIKALIEAKVLLYKLSSDSDWLNDYMRAWIKLEEDIAISNKTPVAPLIPKTPLTEKEIEQAKASMIPTEEEEEEEEEENNDIETEE